MVLPCSRSTSCAASGWRLWCHDGRTGFVWGGVVDGGQKWVGLGCATELAPAPDGGSPGPDWQPDPGWGPPPVGWQFWQFRAEAVSPIRVVVDTWEEAERLAAWHMKGLGFTDAVVRGSGNDGGIDVRSGQAVAQVKYYAQAPVGAPAVQQLRGAAYDRQWAVFYSLSPYTAAAREFADSAGVALFAYDLAGNITAVNGPAKSLAATAKVDVGGQAGDLRDPSRGSRVCADHDRPRTRRHAPDSRVRGSRAPRGRTLSRCCSAGDRHP